MKNVRLEINTWSRELRDACKNIILQKTGKNRKEEEFSGTKYPVTTNLAAYVIVTVFFGSIFGGSFLHLGPFVSEQLGKLGAIIDFVPEQAAVVGSEKTLQEVDPIIYPRAEDGNCILGDEEWNLWFGDMSRDVKDSEHFFLPLDSEGGLFKYSGSIDLEKKCTFSFVPRGERAINYVISFDEFYQIVIGDDDYWTIALRASDSIDSPMLPVKEISIGITRPRLSASWFALIACGENQTGRSIQLWVFDST